MPENPIDISVVIPAFNEERRIGSLLEAFETHCRQSSKRYEIVVVNDGSRDGTQAVLERFAARFRAFLIVKEPRNRGKGAAVRDGMLKASGAIRLFMDADGSYAPSEIEKHLPLFREGYDVVIGSRFVEESPYRDAFARRVMRSFFRFLVSSVLFKGIRDTQCGFKLFTANAANLIFTRSRLRGFGFDLEVLFLAFKKGLAVKEASVRCLPREGSKVNLLRDSVRLFYEIFEIRWIHRHS